MQQLWHHWPHRQGLPQGQEGEAHRHQERAFYRVYLPDDKQIKFELRANKGDPDLYVSNEQPFPSVEDHTWASSDEGADTITVHPNDPAYTTGWYYVGVVFRKIVIEGS